MTREERAAEAILHTEYKNVDLIPSSMELAAAEIELVELQDRTMQLRQALVSIRDEYDYIMIDCPPSMGLTTLNAFSACDSVIIPIQCEYYALEGLSQLDVYHQAGQTAVQSGDRAGRDFADHV